MSETTLRQVQGELRRGYTAVPLVRRVPADLFTPVSAYLRLARREERSFLLESVEGGEHAARYSFLGARPFELIRVRGGEAFVEADGETRRLPGRGLEALSARTRRWRAPRSEGLPRFSGGAVGCVSYELARELEPATRLREPEGDQARLMMFDRIAAFDHLRHDLLLIAHVLDDGEGGLARRYRAARGALDEMEERLRRPLPAPRPARPARRRLEIRALLGRRRFEEGVRRLKRRIAAGDIFQGVLSERFELDLPCAPFEVYRALRSINPSPYMFHLELGGETALGASPEMLARVEDGVVETHPIAGTRRRGKDALEDQALERRLLASPKERAEHAMLVDLGRNDVGRVARPGSVRVPSLMKVERYSHVMHLVSRVTGRLRAGLSPWDAFASCFPAGTVTGAPKIRAMQLIGELEPEPRGLYAGAVVYCDFHGNLDSAIAIRSMHVRGRRARVQAGAGVVADSDPAREYDEALNKAGALLNAARLASGAA